MSGSKRYWLYILLLHLALGALGWYALRDSLHWFLLVEAAILLSLIGAYGLYRRLIAPVNTISQGVAALNDQDFSLRLRQVGSPELDRLIEVYNRLLDNIRAERIQSRSQDLFLRQLVGAADLGLIILDFDDNLSSINPWGRNKLGLSAKTELPEKLAQIDHPLAKHMARLPEESSQLIVLPGNRRYRCDTAAFIDQGFKRRFLLFQDVSNELFAAEKEAYGQVIRMMSHEVNNSFGASRSLINSLLDRSGLSDQEWQDMIEEYLPLVRDRGENLSRFMRRFAEVVRLPPPELERLSLNDLTGKAQEIFAPQAREKGIQVDFYTSVQQPHVMGDRAQLEQVIFNAALNALESIGDRLGGQIEFRVTADPKHAGFCIVDNGPGIAPDEQKMIFSPFYSTKATGQGVGLTLSQDILRSHGAKYSLKTEDDGKTRFRVELERA